MDTISTPNLAAPECWFCERITDKKCRCGRMFCQAHGLDKRCMICALGRGMYEQADTPEPVSNLIIYSLSVASGDSYIVVPANLQSTRPLPLKRVEKVVGALIQMLQTDKVDVRRRASSALANTTNSWRTLDPSQLSHQNKYGTGLLVTDQVRRWLLHVLKESRSMASEPVALAILDKLITADFRDLYPQIAENLQYLNGSGMGTRVHEVFQAFDDFYPTVSYAVNERCELFVYEQYINRQRGCGTMMERLYGPRLRYAPALAKMLKKGVWHSSYERFNEWYPGEDEPY